MQFRISFCLVVVYSACFVSFVCANQVQAQAQTQNQPQAKPQSAPQNQLQAQAQAQKPSDQSADDVKIEITDVTESQKPVPPTGGAAPASASAIKPVAGAIKAESIAKPQYWICRNAADVRTLRIESDNSGVCRARYTKDGVERTVSQTRSSRSCLQIFDNIRRNLEAGNYKCKDISSSRISFSN